MANSLHDNLHDNELRVDEELVRNLIAAQFPHYAIWPLNRLAASGSSNVLFRLGDDLLVRLPRQPGGSVAIDKERRWLPYLGSHLPVAVPEMVEVGEPAFGYSEKWSIMRWLDGALVTACGAGDMPSASRTALAEDLADVVLALRATDVPDAAAVDPALRSYRGHPLAAFDSQMRRNVRQCNEIDGLELDLDLAIKIWEEAMEAPGAGDVGPARWLHGDLVAENLLTRQGRLTAVLDFGGVAIGDPTIDLHGAWEVLDAPARRIFRARLASSDAEWMRGRAWALAIALGALPYYWTTMPGRRRDRLAMALAVLADASG